MQKPIKYRGWTIVTDPKTRRVTAIKIGERIRGLYDNTQAARADIDKLETKVVSKAMH